MTDHPWELRSVCFHWPRPLIAAGFEVALVDGVISPDYENLILRETEGTLCLGISMLTGPMIRSAIRVARAARKLRPELPIIFGGWHPSLMPEQTLSESYVDAIVRGQGELTLVELVKRIAQGHSWDGLRGLSFKQGTSVFTMRWRGRSPASTTCPHPRSTSPSLIDMSRCRDFGRWATRAA